LFSVFSTFYITLLFVAMGQAMHKALTGNYFVYQINDLYHFALNLTLVSAWGVQSDHSFNGPIWSISIEVLLYVVFFVMCRFRLTRWYWLLIAAGIGMFLLNGAHTYIARGLLAFFVGGLSYMAYTRLLKSGHLSSFAKLAIPGLALMWSGILLMSAQPFQLFDPAQENEYLGLLCALVLFPVTMVSLAAIETVRGNFVGPLAKLGDISYASYLLHFPLQLSLATIVTAAMIPPTIYNEIATLGLFFALLIAVSLVSYRWFERPIQNAIRAFTTTPGSTRARSGN
jgi:peptidoglycan/LPS O-acetylase OafA/YrhL